VAPPGYVTPYQAVEANGALISAAPELLAIAEERVEEFWQGWTEPLKAAFRRAYPDHRIHQWEAAIAKARHLRPATAAQEVYVLPGQVHGSPETTVSMPSKGNARAAVPVALANP
jgi:hypothetical protein